MPAKAHALVHADRGDVVRHHVQERRLLAPQASDPRVAVRIAALLIEDERYDSANVTLDSVLAHRAGDPTALAFRAQSAFEAGDDSTGFRYYDSALALAREDAGPLWRQLEGIATPDELRAWAAGPPDRGEFLRAFWARRQPSLFRPANARIAEHFHRLRVARARWPLLHPLVNYQQHVGARWLNARPSAAEELFFLAKGRTSVLVPTDNGGSRRLATFSAGMTFGEMAVLDGAPRSAMIFADTEVECDVLQTLQFEALSMEHPGIKIKLLHNLSLSLCAKLRKANRELSVLE